MEVKRNQPFNVVGQHDGVDVAEYRLLQNAVQVHSLPPSARMPNGDVAFPFASGLGTKGTYTFTALAASEVGSSEPGVVSDPLSTQLDVVPGKPKPFASLTVVVV